MWKKRHWKKKERADCGEHTFLIQCFGPVWAESHGNGARRGEKSARRLARLHPSGIRAQTLQSHDKNNIPHLSDGLQGIPVKMQAFSHRSIPHRIETICCCRCCSQIPADSFASLQLRRGSHTSGLAMHTWPRLCVRRQSWQMSRTILRMACKKIVLAASLELSKLQPGSQEVILD